MYITREVLIWCGVICFVLFWVVGGTEIVTRQNKVEELTERNGSLNRELEGKKRTIEDQKQWIKQLKEENISRSKKLKIWQDKVRSLMGSQKSMQEDLEEAKAQVERSISTEMLLSYVEVNMNFCELIKTLVGDERGLRKEETVFLHEITLKMEKNNETVRRRTQRN